MPFLQDVEIIDLRRSGIPREEWEELAKTKNFAPYKAKLKFVPKDYKRNASIRPNWKFWWCRNIPKDIEDWLFKYNSVPLQVADGYMPTLARYEAGNFMFGDLVCMKISLEDWIAKRRVELEESQNSAEAELRQFDSIAKQSGAMLSEQEKADLGLVG